MILHFFDAETFRRHCSCSEIKGTCHLFFVTCRKKISSGLLQHLDITCETTCVIKNVLFHVINSFSSGFTNFILNIDVADSNCEFRSKNTLSLGRCSLIYCCASLFCATKNIDYLLHITLKSNLFLSWSYNMSNQYIKEIMIRLVNNH